MIAKRNVRLSIFAKAFLFLNNILAFCLLLSYIAPIIPPDVLWIPAFFGLLYPYFLFLNLLFILFWLFAWKKYFLLSLICVLIGWNHIGKLVQINSNEEINSNKLFSVSSFNVRMFDLYNLSTLTKEDLTKDLLNFIKTEDCDIVCFQEFFTNSTHSYTELIKKKTCLQNNYVCKNPFIKGDFGLSTFSKYPIINYGVINFHNSKTNYAIFTDLIIFSDTIRVFNVHFESLRLAKKDYLLIEELNNNVVETKDVTNRTKKIVRKAKKAFIKRAEQARIINNLTEKSPFPVIVCGDFNDTPVSYSYSVLSENLTDAFVESGKGIESTFSVILPYLRIDYILYDENFKSHNFRVSDIKFSDHYPISAQIEKKPILEH